MEFLGVLIAGLLSVVTSVYLYFKFKYTYWKNHKVAYIEPKIPFGNFVMLDPHRPPASLQFAALYKKLKGRGPFAGIYMFQEPAILATDVEFIKTVLAKEFNSFRDRGLYVNERDDPLTCNLLTIDGPRWKVLRTKLTPTFSSGKTRFMYSTVLEVANRFQVTLKSMIDNNAAEFEMKDILARFMTDLIGTCAFGIECNSLKDPNAEFRVMGKRFFDTPRNSALKKLMMERNKTLARLLRMRNNDVETDHFFRNIVSETVALRKEKNVRRNDFMDILIELMDTGKVGDAVVGKLTLEQVAAEAFVFFLAGYESAANVLTFTLFEMALHQDMQDKARQVINETIKKHNGEMTYDCTNEMTYIDQIINESLRKYPPGGILARVATENYKVPKTDYTIRKGMVVYIPVHGLHHDPDHFPDPEVYDPERFAPGKEKNNSAFFPFGDGPRSCIALRFGMMQTRVGLVTLIKNFKFSTCDKTSIPIEYSPATLVLSPHEGMWLKVEPV